MKFIFSFIFLAVAIYHNILFDIFLIFLLFSTSLAVGSYFNVKLENNIDKYLVQFSIGLGFIGFFIWLNTFYNLNYKSIFLFFTILLIIIRFNHIKQIYMDIIKSFASYNLNNKLIFYIFSIFLLFYMINGSYPISTHDALTKHIAIPLTILNSTNYDYNVVESIVFGDYAILSHMYSLYLLALGGTKALVLFVTSISFMSLIILLRISYKINQSNMYINGIFLIFLTTPIVYKLSVNLMIETLSLFFVLSAILLTFSENKIKENILYLGLIVGFSMFIKQISAFYIVPFALYILYIYIKEKYIFEFKNIRYITLAVVFALVIFLPPILLIYYKTGNPFFPFSNGKFLSPYFAMSDFSDPFKNVLGFDIKSLWSIVFHTSDNIEMVKGGVGFIYLLLPIILLLIFVHRSKYVLLLLFIALFGYIISTQLTYNIRYFYGALVLLIPVIFYYIIYIDKKLFFSKNIFSFILLIGFISSSSYVLFHKGNHWGFKKNKLLVNTSFVENPNKSVIKYIPNDRNIKVLSNNDLKRGDFIGHYYSFGWYNTYLVEQIQKSNISPVELLSSFDYYLIDKSRPLRLVEKFDPSNSEISSILTLVAESNSHILYKVNKQFEIFVEEKFDEPLIVSANNTQTRRLDIKSNKYQIEFDVENIQNNSSGRFQINWHDENNKFLGASISTYEVKDDIKVYHSGTIDNIPPKTKYGIFYINAHQGEIKIHSFKIFAEEKSDFLNNLLNEYNKKLPYLSRAK